MLSYTTIGSETVGPSGLFLVGAAFTFDNFPVFQGTAKVALHPWDVERNRAISQFGPYQTVLLVSAAILKTARLALFPRPSRSGSNPCLVRFWGTRIRT